MKEIKHGKNKFYIDENENSVKAELTYYEKDEHTIVADHTFVTEEWRGEGVAGDLFNHLIDFARKNNLKIIPECSYVKKKMESTSEYNDVLAK